MRDYNHEVYQEAVQEPLEKLEAQGKGKIIELPEGVLGFQTTDQPTILVTACHHAPEIYATYQAVLNLLETTEAGITAIPVVDVPRFYEIKKSLDQIMRREERLPSHFPQDTIRGYKNADPRVRPWDYGANDASPLTKDIERLLKQSGLVVDLHNSYVDSFFMLTRPTGAQGEIDFLRTVKDRITQDRPLNDVSMNHHRLEKGILRGKSETSIIAEAARNKTVNLALEIPVHSPKGYCQLLDFDELTDYTTNLLHFIITQYELQLGGNQHETNNGRAA